MPMPHIFASSDISAVINKPDVLRVIEEGFLRYSAGGVLVPPTSHMQFEHTPADIQAKLGYIEGEPFYVLKVASGFYDNPARGLASSSGVMLLFDAFNGQLMAIMLDEGLLTNLRSAAAGVIAAKYLAPTDVTCIGIVGTGIQARLQLEWLQEVIPCRCAVVWGREESHLDAYVADMGPGYDITPTTEMSELTRRCKLIVTTTAATAPLLFAEQLLPGTHITAMGADAHGKQEVDPNILYKADIVVADSISQCVDYGEISHATNVVLQIRELGSVIENPRLQRRDNEQLTVADLTGVAVQDAKIAALVYDRLLEGQNEGK